MAQQERKNKHIYQITALALVIVFLAGGIYFAFGAPAITGQVIMNEEGFNTLTPFGFNLGMLVIGAMAAIYTVLLITKESVEK